MGALRKAGVWLGLVEEDTDYDNDARHNRAERADRGYGGSDRYLDDEYNGDYSDDELSYDGDYNGNYGEQYAEPAPVRRPRPERPPLRSSGRGSVSAIGSAASARAETRFETHDNLALAPQVTLRERAVVSDEEEPYRITTLHPTTYNEARTIGEHFRNSIPVIMNLTEMDEADAKRLVDFAAGLAFGLRGSIERVTNRVFLLSPANVTVTAEDRARIAEGGFFNQS